MNRFELKGGSSLLKSLISIVFAPNVTLSRLLEERKFGRSWGTTWFLIGMNMLVMFILLVFLFRMMNTYREPTFYWQDELTDRFVLWVIFAFLTLGGLVQSVLLYVLGRVCFAWIIRLGLRISAAAQYPQDPEERREKGRLLSLIHPHTLWISHWPYLIGLLLAPLLFLLPGFRQFLNKSESGAFMNETAVMQITLVLGILLLVWQLVQFGMWVYMIVVRTIAIQKIYGIGAGQAFWGPFLVYFLLYFAGAVFYAMVLVLSAAFGGGPTDSGYTPDFHSTLSI